MADYCNIYCPTQRPRRIPYLIIIYICVSRIYIYIIYAISHISYMHVYHVHAYIYLAGQCDEV